MFKVTSSPQFTHTVDVMVPSDGGHDRQSVKVTYRVLASGTDEAEHDLNTTNGQIAFCKASVVALDDLIDDDKKPVPYSDAIRDQLIVLPFVRAAICRGYIAAVTKVAVGN